MSTMHDFFSLGLKAVQFLAVIFTGLSLRQAFYLMKERRSDARNRKSELANLDEIRDLKIYSGAENAWSSDSTRLSNVQQRASLKTSRTKIYANG
jgi:hypothetical protein